jgi:hypothetical protein
VNLFLVPLVVFPVALILMLGAGWLTGRDPEQPAPRRFMAELAEPYGPFPVDTGPLLLVSEALAANDALEREVRAMIRAAERKIGPIQ